MLTTKLIDVATKQPILNSLLVTQSSLERMKGLLGKPPLSANNGLLIAPCNSVHTLFMRYSIDVIYINNRGVIKKIVPALKPWRFSFCFRASSTLELAKDSAALLNLKTGQQLSW